jgi:hypothetical protein
MSARLKQYPVRIAMGLVIFSAQLLTAWPHFSIWPLIWVATTLLNQTLEDRLDLHLLGKHAKIPTKFLLISSLYAAVNSFIYCTSSIFFWHYGPLSKVFR